MSNKLILGDCLEKIKGIPSDSVDLVVTDCPYKIVSGGCTTKKSKCNGILSGSNQETKAGKLFKDNDIEFSDWLPELYRVLKDRTHCYIMINGRNLSKLQNEAEKVGFEFQNLLVWDKGNVTPNRYYMQQVEFILLLRKGQARTINNAGSSNLISIRNMVGKKVHPTEKPVSLMERFISNSSNESDVVLDCFMGSGSAGVASRNLNRHFIGIEIDELYFNVAKKRIMEEVSNEQ